MMDVSGIFLTPLHLIEKLILSSDKNFRKNAKIELKGIAVHEPAC